MANITLPVNTTIAVGTHTFGPVTLADSTHTEATLTIDRTTASGFNSLDDTTVVTFEMDYSSDGGTTWTVIATQTVVGGTFITKGGVTESISVISFGIGSPFASGTQVRATVTVTGPSSVAIGTGTAGGSTLALSP